MTDWFISRYIRRVSVSRFIVDSDGDCYGCFLMIWCPAHGN